MRPNQGERLSKLECVQMGTGLAVWFWSSSATHQTDPAEGMVDVVF